VQHQLQLDCETGVGLSGYGAFDIFGFLLTQNGEVLQTENNENIVVTVDPAYDVQGASPSVMLRWSDDGGHTWSNEHWKSMGQV
jgi:hypothetical protein